MNRAEQETIQDLYAINLKKLNKMKEQIDNLIEDLDWQSTQIRYMKEGSNEQ